MLLWPYFYDDKHSSVQCSPGYGAMLDNRVLEEDFKLALCRQECNDDKNFCSDRAMLKNIKYILKSEFLELTPIGELDGSKPFVLKSKVVSHLPAMGQRSIWMCLAYFSSTKNSPTSLQCSVPTRPYCWLPIKSLATFLFRSGAGPQDVPHTRHHFRGWSLQLYGG